MLARLSLRDFIFIDRLDLEFRPGLCVLTGETGAGKSILLDALGLALGDRPAADIVRADATQAMVAAAFALGSDHPIRALLDEQGLAAEDELVLRRTVAADGKSRAFVNDQPASAGLLRRLGELLVERHGQHDEQGLLDARRHRELLDAFAGAEDDRQKVRAAAERRREARQILAERETALRATEAEADFLRHALDELRRLGPEPGEEARLAERRMLAQQSGKLAEGLRQADEVLSAGDSIESRLGSAHRLISRLAERAGERLRPLLDALERASAETAEVMNLLGAERDAIAIEPEALDRIEERLFALRALARKHRVAVDDLAALAEDFARRLDALDAGSAEIPKLRRAAEAVTAAYAAAAAKLSALRQAAAARLDREVERELAPLKLGKVRFVTEVTFDAPDQGGPEGVDRITFKVATQPGAAPGALGKIASGGELSRLMLALKVVLARRSSAPTLVFDEVDRGIGGATAAAVGVRLGRLAGDLQVLVVTHSPQVAARGTHHWRVAKGKGGALAVAMLDPQGREEEIARMLAGATVTAEARAAAASLLQESTP